MKVSIYMPLMALMVMLYSIASCERRGDISSKNLKVNDRQYRNVCEINLNETRLGSQYVRIKGRVIGFHEIILTDDKCPEPENYIQLKLSDAQRKQLVDLSNRGKDPSNSNLSGMLSVYGLLVVDGGRLTQYPARVIDLNKPPTDIGPLIVNRLDSITIEDYLATETDVR